ncbi:hypothetical protein GCM10010520_54850 [Rhizobium viscosum]
MRRNDRGQAHNEARGEVDAAGNDNEGLTDSEKKRRYRENRDRTPIERGTDKGPAKIDARPKFKDYKQGGEKNPCA